MGQHKRGEAEEEDSRGNGQKETERTEEISDVGLDMLIKKESEAIAIRGSRILSISVLGASLCQYIKSSLGAFIHRRSELELLLFDKNAG